MSWYKYNEKTEKNEVVSGCYKFELVEHYKYEGSEKYVRECINYFAPEVRRRKVIPKPAVEKIVKGFGYI